MLWPSVRSPGWLRMNSQTLPRAGPHAEPTAPGATSRRTAATLRGVNSLYVDGDWHSSIINQDRDHVMVTAGQDQAARELDGRCLGDSLVRRRGEASVGSRAIQNSMRSSTSDRPTVLELMAISALNQELVQF